jgi:hypothetical protein
MRGSVVARSLLLSLVVSFSWSPAAWADQFVLITNDSGIVASAAVTSQVPFMLLSQDQYLSPSGPHPLAMTLDREVFASASGGSAQARASLNVLATDSSISGQGSVSALASGGSAQLFVSAVGFSAARFVLQLAAPYEYLAQLSGSHADLRLVDYTSGAPASVFGFSSDEVGGMLQRQSGVLQQGLYTLNSSAIATADARASSAGNFAFSFALTPSAAPVPEPATLLLVGAGLAAAAARRRTQRR